MSVSNGAENSGAISLQSRLMSYIGSLPDSVYAEIGSRTKRHTPHYDVTTTVRQRALQLVHYLDQESRLLRVQNLLRAELCVIRFCETNEAGDAS